jgi:hypothetical protein
MELLVQLCLTACVTTSYGLWKWLASSSPIYGTACATVSYSLCNYVLQIVQLCLTACVIMSYKLSNCVLRLMEMVSKQFSHLWKRL